jgi:hypothetical protein
MAFIEVFDYIIIGVALIGVAQGALWAIRRRGGEKLHG